MEELRYKILIVDDEPRNIELLGEILDDLRAEFIFEIEFSSTSDSSSVIERHEKEGFDLILLDRMMPKISGDDICKTLKASNSFRAPKVIMISARASNEEKFEGFSLGADDYITKPFNSLELLARINIQLKNKNLEDQLTNHLSKSQHEAAIGQLTAGITHDFKNILTTIGTYQIIRFYCSKILDEGVSEQVKKYINMIENNCDSIENACDFADSLIQGLLIYTKQENSKKIFSSLENAVRNPVEILKRQIKSSGVDFKLSFSENISKTLHSSSEIQQVVLNLIVNALDAMEGKEKKELLVELKSSEESNVIEIEDSGEGIPGELQEKIFDNLFTTKKEKGTGLGLYTVRRIVEEHGGTIELKSSLGSGSKFIISLPVIKN